MLFHHFVNLIANNEHKSQLSSKFLYRKQKSLWLNLRIEDEANEMRPLN